MKLLRVFTWAAPFLAAGTLVPNTGFAQLTHVNIYPTNVPPGIVGTYTPGGAGAGTITSDGVAFFPPAVNASNVGDVGDVLTFVYESVTGDFDRRVRISSITPDASDPAAWTIAALQVRTGTNSYNTSFQLVAGNPLLANGGAVGFAGRALDGQAYTWFGRNNYNGVNAALPNQWLRLRRVGDYFAAYVGTNGTTWTLVGQRYQKLPATLLVGPSAASGTPGLPVSVAFASYGATPLNDPVPPTLVSAGTLDKKVVGVKFSEPVASAAAKVIANYEITQGTGAGAVTITGIEMGISGDAVYLNVTGLTNNVFTVRVIGGVTDTAGNPIAANSTVAARALNWNHGDIGYIQDTANRPQPGDDPGRVGEAVMISSDENPEIEIVGGGSNAWNPGDFIHYIWRSQPLSGNFDVTVALSRNDRPANCAGWGNSGIMLRAADYNPGDNPDPTILTNYAATQVQMVASTTYEEGAGNVGGPNRGAIPLWRTDIHGGYGNGNAGFGAYGNVIGGVQGYYSELRGIDASGNIDPQSTPDSARYLRIVRVGTQYTFYASWNRTAWAVVDGPINLPQLPDQLLLGFSTMNDTGAGTPPYGGYGGDGHELDPNDPYNPAVAGGLIQNDSNYSVQRIKVFPNGVTDPVPVGLIKVDVRPQDESTTPPNAIAGTWASTGTYSFSMTGGGTSGNSPWQNLNSPFDGTSGGDELTFAYETVTGDFDKQVQITSLTNTLFNGDGTAWDYTAGANPVDAWARAGLMVRTDTNSYNACLQIVAGNPVGANVVRVFGHGLDGQKYTQFSRDYPGVSNVLPNQYLRMKRVGNNFSFYVSKDGVVWAMVAQQYMELPSQVLFGPVTAASLNPNDAANNPSGAISSASASFTAYRDVTGDVTPPVLMSVGTIDKKTVGVKFSKQVSSTSGTAINNYKLSQGTVSAAKLGIGGDSVYLTVTGLTSDSFAVTVTNVTDTFGNKLVGSQSATGKTTAWTATDIGYIQNPGARPTPGDDPYRIGQTVAVSSEDDDTSELEIVGGGSNEWLGDYLHYVYKPTAVSGDFDVACKISRYDKENTAGAGGYDNSGMMMRASVYLAGEDYTVNGTKVPFIDNITYHNGGGGPIPVWRDTPGGNAGGSGNQLNPMTVIGGLKGYFPDTRATNAAGQVDAASSPYQAQWLRINRTGGNYSFYASWDGQTWNMFDGPRAVSGIPDSLLIGYMTMNDSGDADAPFSAYIGNGHTIDPNDPLGVTQSGHTYQNESNFTVTKVRIYQHTSSIGAIKASKVGGNAVINYSGTLVSSPSLSGPWTVVTPQGSPFQIAPTAAQQYYRVIP